MFSGDINTVRLAIAASSDQINSRDDWTFLSPLEHAVIEGASDVVDTLLQAKASPFIQYDCNPCAFHLVVILSGLKSSKSKKIGVDDMLAAFVANTAFPISEYVNRTCSCKSNMYEFDLSNRINFSIVDGTALHIAVLLNKPDIVEFLVSQAGADCCVRAREVDITHFSRARKSLSDSTPLDIAEYLELRLIISILSPVMTRMTPVQSNVALSEEETSARSQQNGEATIALEAHTDDNDTNNDNTDSLSGGSTSIGASPKKAKQTASSDSLLTAAPAPAPAVIFRFDIRFSSIYQLPWGEVAVSTLTGATELVHKCAVLIEFIAANPTHAGAYALLAKDLPVGETVTLPAGVGPAGPLDSVTLALKAIELDDTNADAFRVLAASCAGSTEDGAANALPTSLASRIEMPFGCGVASQYQLFQEVAFITQKYENKRRFSRAAGARRQQKLQREEEEARREKELQEQAERETEADRKERDARNRQNVIEKKTSSITQDVAVDEVSCEETFTGSEDVWSDEKLLRYLLRAVHPRLLEPVLRHYTVEHKRDSIRRRDESTYGNKTTNRSSGIVCGVAGGVISTDSNQEGRIIVRSRSEGGHIVIDFGTLMHQIGHAFDLEVAAFAHAGKMQPLHLHEDVADAMLDKEHTALASTFHEQSEFVAEVFARYCLDRSRTLRTFPKMVETFDKNIQRLGILSNPTTESLVNPAKLKEALEAMLPVPPISSSPMWASDSEAQSSKSIGSTGNSSPSFWKYIAAQERYNLQLEKKLQSRRLYIVGFISEDDKQVSSCRLLAQYLSRRLFFLRTMNLTTSSPYSVADSFIEKDLNNSIQDVLKEKYDHHSFVLFASAEKLTSQSQGLLDYLQYSSTTADRCVLVLYGSHSSITSVKQLHVQDASRILAQWHLFSIQPMTATEVEMHLRRIAESHGKFISDEAVSRVGVAASEGHVSTVTDVSNLWVEIQQMQSHRMIDTLLQTNTDDSVLNDADIYRQDDDDCEEILRIRLQDVSGALKILVAGASSDPMKDLEAMIGISEVKRKITNMIDTMEIHQISSGTSSSDVKFGQMNFLFLGNPGTGKTTVAKIMRRLLQKLKVVTSSKYTEVSAREVKDAVQLFQKNKNGVIFIDEFHQLNDSEEGRNALKAMVPMLADPESRTVFIGAGYTGPVEKMIRDVDAGLDRRFPASNRFLFEDYSKEELGMILDIKAKAMDPPLSMTKKVRAVALESIVVMQRGMMNPTNGGAVEDKINTANSKRIARLSDLKRTDYVAFQRIRDNSTKGNAVSTETKEDLGPLELTIMDLVEDDVRAPPRVHIDDFWNMIATEFSGLDHLLTVLRSIESKVNYARQQGLPPLDVRFNFMLQGPPGTGKTTIAKRIIGPFFCALDVVPSPDVIAKKSGDLQGTHVGQTAPQVRAMFEEGWGKTLFVDEISGICSPGALYQNEAIAEVLTHLEDSKGRFIFVGADYKHNIDKFLALNDGLASRIPYRIDVPCWEAEQSAKALIYMMGKSYRQDLSGCEALLIELFGPLTSIHFQNPAPDYDWVGFASGRTVEDLVESIMDLHITSCSSEDPDKKISENTLREAFSQVEDNLQSKVDREKQKLAAIAITGEGSAHGKGSFALQAQAAVGANIDEAGQEAAAALMSQAELDTYLAAIETIDKMKKFQDRYNEHPELAEEDKADPNSDYNKKLGELLEIDPQEAKAVRIRVARKVKAIVKKLTTTQVERFKYHCPYCGGIDSPSCGFINYPMSWKIEHSLRKPWNEDIVTEVDVEVEREVLEDVEV